MKNIPPSTYNGLDTIASTNEVLQPGELRFGNFRMFPQEGKVHFVYEDAVAMARLRERSEYMRYVVRVTAYSVVAIVYVAASVYLSILIRS